MRFSAVALGASLASAVALPPGLGMRAATQPQRQHVDLAPFEAGKFTLLSPEELAAKSRAASSSSNRNPSSPSSSSSSKISSSSSPGGADDTVSALAACASPRTRVEWRNLSDDDRRDFVRATRCLMDAPARAGFQGSQTRYEDLVWVHQQLSGQLHGVATFLPWHRYFLSAFEALLRDECGYGGARPLPWWDETRDAGAFSAAPLFTDDYFGPAPPRTDGGDGTCVGSGAFAGVTLHVGPGAAFTDHCLSRAVDESLTGQCNQGFVDMCNRYGDFAAMATCSEGGPHAYGHNGVGAVMSDVGPSPGDPLFFLHHAFIDRNWWTWQSADPAARLYQVGGYTNNDEPRSPLTLETVLTSRGLKPDATVNSVMDTQAEFLCYRYDY